MYDSNLYTVFFFHGSTWNVSRTTMKYSDHLNFPHYREMFHGRTGSCSWLFFSCSTMKTTWKNISCTHWKLFMYYSTCSIWKPWTVSRSYGNVSCFFRDLHGSTGKNKHEQFPPMWGIPFCISRTTMKILKSFGTVWRPTRGCIQDEPARMAKDW
jgi:hypothetical protein